MPRGWKCGEGRKVEASRRTDCPIAPHRFLARPRTSLSFAAHQSQSADPLEHLKTSRNGMGRGPRPATITTSLISSTAKLPAPTTSSKAATSMHKRRHGRGAGDQDPCPPMLFQIYLRMRRRRSGAWEGRSKGFFYLPSWFPPSPTIGSWNFPSSCNLGFDPVLSLSLHPPKALSQSPAPSPAVAIAEAHFRQHVEQPAG